MKRIGYWSSNPPDLKDAIAHGELKGFQDAQSFELWLQCVFLPNARRTANKGKFPPQSEVGLMAIRQYDYHSCVDEAHPLMRLLQRFDEIIESRSA